MIGKDAIKKGDIVIHRVDRQPGTVMAVYPKTIDVLVKGVAGKANCTVITVEHWYHGSYKKYKKNSILSCK